MSESRGCPNRSRPRRGPRLLDWGPLLVAFAACSDQGPNAPEQLGTIAENQQRWQSTGPDDYVYAVERLCFCGLIGPVRVTVVDGVATERIVVASGEPLTGEAADLFPTVDGLFDLLIEAVAADAHEVEVTYDPETGVPVDFRIDYEELVDDEELGVRVTEPVTPLGPQG